MIDFDELPPTQCDWGLGPRVPRLWEVRRGFLYVEADSGHLRELLRQCSQVAPVWGAMGPRLFFARDDGPFVAYDAKLVDQNENRKVEQREWPFCFGDEVWVSCVWITQPTLVHFSNTSVVGNRLYVGSPGDPASFASAVERVARRAAGEHLAVLNEREFFKSL